MTALSARELALHLARVIDDKSGEDIVVLTLPKGQLTDYVVVATGRSDRQVHTLADECRHFCKELAIGSRAVEGETGWMVVDCYDVVVHALTQEMRDFYRLERIWPEAELIEWQTEVAAMPRLVAEPVNDEA
jgi:ribosome-associated protein